MIIMTMVVMSMMMGGHVGHDGCDERYGDHDEGGCSNMKYVFRIAH